MLGQFAILSDFLGDFLDKKNQGGKLLLLANVQNSHQTNQSLQDYEAEIADRPAF